jgi:hypothetical protein
MELIFMIKLILSTNSVPMGLELAPLGANCL